ncbi:MAG: hypothetical protein K2W95_13330 [Candidatus Obscuribacterales bacterium]|nr:hypothetical protein [Candidatus Obscuribacterales bacterium]
MDQVELTRGLLARETDDSALERTGKLLVEGFLAGGKERAKELSDAPAELCGTVALCAATGAALNLMSRAGGRWGTAAKAASGTMAVLLAGDVLRRGVPTVGAIANNWHSPENFEHNKDVVSAYAGSALVDYPLMLVAGYAGFRGAGAIPVRGDIVSPPFPRCKSAPVATGRVSEFPGALPGTPSAYELPPIQSVQPFRVAASEASPGPRLIDLQVQVGYELPPIGRVTPDSPIQNPWTTPVLPKTVSLGEFLGAPRGNPGAYTLPQIPRMTLNGGEAIRALTAQQRVPFVPPTVPVDLLRQ